MRRAAALAVLFITALTTLVPAARAETSELRISKGYGIHYLPLYVMEHERLIERAAEKAGLGTIAITWSVVDGGNNINEAMLAGTLDVAAIGVPGYLTLWAKAHGNPRLEMIGICGIGAGSLYLNTRNPAIKTLADFTERDKIAMPGIKTSFAAVILQMAAAKAFGDENYAKLDPLTVGMPYPEALAALTSGKTEIDAHMASPPFSYLELDHPEIHRVLNSVDVLGKMTVIMAYAPMSFYQKNPKLAAVFIAAEDQAAEMIARDKPWAAHLYNEMAAVKSPDELVLRTLEDPDTHFTATPEGVMMFADFMTRVGTIKQKPARWSDAFVPELAERPGN
jgi:NitT/TauT family transport system substrate-binding protein